MTRFGVAAAVVCTTVLAGCGGGGRPPAHAVTLDHCLRTTSTASFSSDGSRLRAAVLGTGSTGVVLANESDLDLCSWLPLARRLAKQGFRVLLFDYAGGPPDDEVAAAANELRRLGASRVVLGGASEGAKAAILAAAAHPKLAAAVVALSPERYLQGFDVEPSAAKLRVPALVAVSREDPYSASDAPDVERHVGSARKRLVVVPGSAHGVALLHGAPAATVAAAVLDFLAPLGPRRRAPSLAAECGGSLPPATRVTFTAADGVHLTGDVIGGGRTTVVLDHESGSSLCGWFPYAGELARAGYRVLLFDERGTGTRLDLDVVAAVDKAKELGAANVVAMGASLGGAATLLAAGRDCFLVSGIVSVSGEVDLRSYGRGVPPLYAKPFERRIAAPLLVVGSKDDPLIPQRDVVHLLAKASSRAKSSLLVAGSAHGWDLLQGSEASTRVRGAIARFLAHARAPVSTGCSA